MRKTLTILATIVITAAVTIGGTVYGARTDDVWQERLGTWIETQWPLGRDVLINGLNRYLNFGSDSGTSGYGFRDNAGTMEYKNSGGAWAGIGSGGDAGSGGGNSKWASSTPATDITPNAATGVVMTRSTTTNATTTNFFSTTASSTNFFSSLLTVGGTALSVDSSRNVGVGTTAPASKLTVEGVFRIDNGAGTFTTFAQSSSGLTIVPTNGNGRLSFAPVVGRAYFDAVSDILAQRFVDRSSTGYYTDPGNAGLSMNLAGGFITVGSSTIAGALNITGSSTLGQATSTSLYVSGNASTSNLYLALGACDSLDTNSAGKVVCGTDASGGGSGGAGNSKWATSTLDTLGVHLNSALRVGIGTTSPRWALQIASSTGPQLTLSDNTNTHWSFRNAGGIFYLATSSNSTYATSTSPALTINSSGFFGLMGTTSPGTALSIGNTGTEYIHLSHTGTSTFAKGINLNSGCFALAGTCLGTLSWTSETPSGTINGSNTGFTLTSTPDTNSLALFLNGAYQTVTTDYTLSGTTITFVSAPLTGSVLTARYSVGGGIGGVGGGGGGGSSTWATTTSSVAGVLNNYSLNATDVVVIGSNATTSAEFWFDPNNRSAFIDATTTVKGTFELDATPDCDHCAVGPTTRNFTAGESIAELFSVFLHSDGKWWKTDADSTASSTGMLGIFLYKGTTAAANDTVLIAMPGSYIRDDSFNWTPGATIYLDTGTGAWSATAPSGTDDVVRVVGFAVTADVVYFNPSPDYITLE